MESKETDEALTIEHPMSKLAGGTDVYRVTFC